VKFEEGNWYYFSIENVIDVPDKGDHFVLRHASGRKMLLNAQYYVKFNFRVGDTIQCRVDKVSCTGHIYLEPKHPFYIENYLYDFIVESVATTDDGIVSITVRDILDNPIQVYITTDRVINLGDTIQLEVYKVKKGIPVLIVPGSLTQQIHQYVKDSLLTLRVEDTITANNEAYYQLTDGRSKAFLKVKHFQNYGLAIGGHVECRYRGVDSNGFLKVEPINPWYRVGERYSFSIAEYQEIIDLDGRPTTIALVIDKAGKKCGVKLPENDRARLAGSREIMCRVVGFRKGRPQLELDPVSV
jgi:hypothetical protein